ncbi:MAG: hypothetical protein GY820_01635, partial [Gammaproteobacteria bacterium]|nr:hypothetical protein [Gammaproteobacteria bacterium]
MRSISPQAESDFYSQLKDKTTYSELVCEGQKDGETDQDFMSRLRSMTLTKEEYRASPKIVFQHIPDDKPDDDDSSTQKGPQSAQAKAQQPPPVAPKSQPVPQSKQQQTSSAPQKQAQKVVPQVQTKKVTQSRPLTGAAYHVKVIRQMMHYFGSVWTGISDAQRNLAYSQDETIREEPMTSEEKEKLESTPARYILPPQELFYPTDSPSERTDWWCEITAQAILEATTNTNRSAEKYLKREKEQGRISALEDHVVEIALAHGGQVHKLSEEEMTEIDILKVNEAEARLALQSKQPSTSQSQIGTTKNAPQNKMDTTEKDAVFPPLKSAAASATETVPQRKKSSGKSSRASS